ncbi:helix-turn-helix domain-containing protein [Corynebacterium anserum]|uniref:Helix-turn-helix domain-containing protein n=1 Tax=Corynebacterium anserum TaxID=2684406 RepID=A0A7G7YNR4_9CORY|nr:helix-turn-helix transcriptional regulator [Corynebacterium anserum]MBC2681724.1 helix-turn-helix domain-containing protein [Corynebacterium anserum]QNH96134.1 helix-turn-helix domain-containing protein [Corynebacterium anserum]
MTQQTIVRDAAQSDVSDSQVRAASFNLSGKEPLLREALGATLKEFRSQSGFTLRELAQVASVSPGYLSELERGRKEVSSELLASVCHAMGVSVASVILEAASMMALDAAAAELAASMVPVNTSR